jgi:hypothetical protein
MTPAILVLPTGVHVVLEQKGAIMKSRKLKITLLALLGFIAAEGAVQAQAADITVVNQSSTLIHPYYRSNCWDTSVINGKPGEWVFFGGILGNSQFTWPQFELLLKAKCKSPKVSFTFALDGEAPPTGNGTKHRTTKLDFDATVPLYEITIAGVPQIVDVTPADDDGDGDN